MYEEPQPLGGTVGVGATSYCFACGQDETMLTYRAFPGHVDIFFRAVSLLDNRFNNLRNNIAGPLHQDMIADLQSLSFDFPFVMQRCPADDNTADIDGLK